MKSLVYLMALGAGILVAGCTKVTRDENSAQQSTQLTSPGTGSGGGSGGGSGPGTGALTPVQCAVSTVVPAYWVNSPNLDFLFNCAHSGGSVIQSVECELDGLAQPCQSLTAHSVTGLANGHHHFRVKALALDGSTGLSHYAFWGTDLLAPLVDHVELVQLTRNAPTFNFRGIERGESGFFKFQCRLSRDFTQWQDCLPPRLYPELTALQDYAFEVRALDHAGNVGPAVSLNFRTQSAPSIGACVITTPVAAWSRIRTQPLQFACVASDEPIAAVECRNGSVAWSACDSPTQHLLRNLTDGPQEFEVRMRTTSGKTSLPQRVSWTVDTHSPRVDINSASVSTLQPSFGFVGSDPGGLIAGYSCQLQILGGAADAWSPCSSPKTYSSGILAAKNYTFRVKATDAAGNESAPAEYQWISNPGVGPNCTILSRIPGGVSSSRDLLTQFLCSSHVPVTQVQCRLDSAPWANCQSPTSHRLSSLAEGVHAFSVRAMDSFGNWGASSLALGWVSDFTPPSVTIALTEVDHPSARIHFTGSDQAGGSGIEKYECALNGASWVGCTSPAQYSGLVLNANYDFRVRAIDFAGLTSAVASSKFKSVPKAQAPSCRIGLFGPGGVDPLASVSNSTQVVLKSECLPTDHLREIQCSSDGVNWRVCSSPTTITETVAGKHCVWVRGKDEFNRFGIAEKACWTLDNLAPRVMISESKSIPGTTAAMDRLQTLFTATDRGAAGIDHSECRLTGSDGTRVEWQRCSSPWVLTGAGLGRQLGVHYQVEVKAQDQVQNWSEVARYEWTVQKAVADYELAIPVLNPPCPWGKDGNDARGAESIATARAEKSVELKPTSPDFAAIFGLDLTRIQSVSFEAVGQFVAYDDEFFFLANDSLLIASSGAYESRYPLNPSGFRTYSWEKTLHGPIVRNNGARDFCAFSSVCKLPPTETMGEFNYVMTAEGSRKLLERAMVDRKLTLRLIALGDNNYSKDCRILVRKSSQFGPFESVLRLRLRVQSR